MVTNSNQVSGHRGLRGQVLIELKKTQPVTAKELGDRFSVSANAVRRHLKELEAEGLVAVGREQHGVGAPSFVYRLTDRGEALFPTGYRDTLSAMLDHVAERDGRQAVVEMFEARYRQLAARLKAELAAAPESERLAIVSRVLTDAGYMAEWSEADGVFRLSEHNCAMRAIVERYPEICAVEERFLKEVLRAQVEREAHIAHGCNSCEYAISFAGGSSRSATERVEV